MDHEFVDHNEYLRSQSMHTFAGGIFRVLKGSMAESRYATWPDVFGNLDDPDEPGEYIPQVR